MFQKVDMFGFTDNALRELKKETNLYFYDDLLILVKEALEGPEGAALTGAVHQKYDAALVDEFQEAGFSVSVLTYGERDKERSYAVHRISKKYPYVLRSLLFFLYAFVLSFKHDLIYNQDLYGSGRASLWIKRILKNKRLVTRFVGDSAWEKAYSRGWVREDILSFEIHYVGLMVRIVLIGDVWLLPSCFPLLV